MVNTKFLCVCNAHEFIIYSMAKLEKNSQYFKQKSLLIVNLLKLADLKFHNKASHWIRINYQMLANFLTNNRCNYTLFLTLHISIYYISGRNWATGKQKDIVFLKKY